MSTTTSEPLSDDSTDLSSAGTDVLRWSVRPLANDPRKLAIISGIAIAAGVFGGIVFRQPLMGLVGFAMILGSTAEHWMGSSFALDQKGVKARTVASVTAMEWTQVKRVAIGTNTLRISPLQTVSALEPFRGVLLRTTPSNRQSVLDFIRRHAPEGVTYEDARTEEG